MINEIKTIISDTLLIWALGISPKGRKERLAEYLVAFLNNEILKSKEK
jgi:hypothetical protein